MPEMDGEIILLQLERWDGMTLGRPCRHKYPSGSIAASAFFSKSSILRSRMASRAPFLIRISGSFDTCSDCAAQLLFTRNSHLRIRSLEVCCFRCEFGIAYLDADLVCEELFLIDGRVILAA